MPSPDLLAPPLARMMRCQRRSEPAALSYIDLLPDGTPRPRRGVRGGRLNDGMSWALAAWAEIMDRDPTFTHAIRKGSTEQVKTSPWRKGKESAWAYLNEIAQDKIWGGPARQMLADLERRGITR